MSLADIRYVIRINIVLAFREADKYQNRIFAL